MFTLGLVQPAVAAPPVQPATAGARPRASSPEQPRLVVALVYDQLGSDTLLRHLGWLDAEGALRRAVEQGVYLERSVYPYASTLTAPGHAAIHTGTPPSVNGVDNNSTWDAARGRAVSAVSDARHPVFGREREKVGVGFGRLQVPTVSAQLKAATAGAGRVVSLSVKDRSAVLSVGAAADDVLWFDAKVGAFTSSSAWGKRPPAWLERHQVAHPLRALLTPWLPLYPERYAKQLGPDAAAGEGDLHGLGTTFPHGWERVRDPLGALSCTPQLSEYLVGLARAAVVSRSLGRDAAPDLLALSISGTDCAGHIFGPDSWEYVDHLVRADRALGKWLGQLARELPLAVVITSDHGVAPLPERHAPAAAIRLAPAQLKRGMEVEVERQLGAGPWVAGILSPFVYLSARAKAHPEPVRVLAAALAALRQQRGVRDVFTAGQVRGWINSADPLERSLALGMAASNPCDLVLVPQANVPLELGETAGKGTNHGSPYAYDREVPVLAWGTGVPKRRSGAPVDQLRVAATLAKLLGVRPPRAAAQEPLF